MAAFARIRIPACYFRPWTIDQPLLLPPSVQDFVGEDHLARFILALVLEPLDLGEIESAYASERGQPPFDPAMMTALLLYGYCNGVYSSRRIAKAARERSNFLSIVGLESAGFSHRLRDAPAPCLAVRQPRLEFTHFAGERRYLRETTWIGADRCFN